MARDLFEARPTYCPSWLDLARLNHCHLEGEASKVTNRARELQVQAQNIGVVRLRPTLHWGAFHGRNQPFSRGEIAVWKSLSDRFPKIADIPCFVV